MRPANESKRTMQRTRVMNNTKWEELRQAMIALGELAPAWRTRHVASGHVTPWDREWFYHFREGGYGSIEWVELEFSSAEQAAAVLAALAPIHLPGDKTEKGVRIYGHVRVGQVVSYIDVR